MQKKRGRKKLGDKRKIARTITMDAALPPAVEKVTPNLSGFLNEAGWEKLKRLQKKSVGPKRGPNQ
jgi:hypothetical protein